MLTKLIVICLLYVNANGASFSSKRSPMKMFEDFMRTYNITYENPDIKLMRFERFKVNLKYIEKLNERHPYATFGITLVADMSYEERNGITRPSTMNFEELQANFSGIPEHMKRFSSIPKSIDWRDRNAVTPVKAQGSCGSCWAFSAVAAIESQYAIKHNKIIDLSEQQIVDCVKNGCNGGRQEAVIYHVGENGLVLEEDYPYKAVQGECLNMTKKSVVTISKDIHYELYVSETQMKNLVATYGPLSIGLYVRDEFHFYKRGIMTPLPEECKFEQETNHAVLLVGYGEENDVPYWLIKNSWGTSFGEDGYFKIVRGEEICGIIQSIILFHLH